MIRFQKCVIPFKKIRCIHNLTKQNKKGDKMNIKKRNNKINLSELTNDLFHVLELLEPESKGKEIKINNNVLTISYN